jgi:hypothetical protein
MSGGSDGKHGSRQARQASVGCTHQAVHNSYKEQLVIFALGIGSRILDL